MKLSNILSGPFTYKVDCIKRLVREWGQHNQLVVAYEFDNTVFDTHNIGYDFKRVIAALREAEEAGLQLIVFTGRADDKIGEVTEYLNKERIPFHYVNKTPDFIPFKAQKVFYNLLLDSRAGLSEALEILEALLAHIRGSKHVTLLNMEIG